LGGLGGPVSSARLTGMSIMTRSAMGDAPRIAELLDQLGYPASVKEVASRLEYWLVEARSRLIAVEAENELVGVAALHALPLLEHTGWRGRLVALAVDEEWRGRGVGGVLVSAAEAAARELGCRAWRSLVPVNARLRSASTAAWVMWISAGARRGSSSR
jgi:GNAT superfamily N-acetyltransferase